MKSAAAPAVDWAQRPCVAPAPSHEARAEAARGYLRRVEELCREYPPSHGRPLPDWLARAVGPSATDWLDALSAWVRSGEQEDLYALADAEDAFVRAWRWAVDGGEEIVGPELLDLDLGGSRP